MPSHRSRLRAEDMGRAEVRTERAEDKGVSRCLAKPEAQGVRFALSPMGLKECHTQLVEPKRNRQHGNVRVAFRISHLSPDARMLAS